LATTTTITGANTTVTYTANDLGGTELYEYSNTSSPIYLHGNDHGDVTWTTDESGSVTGQAAYDPFGTLAAGSSLATSARWQGSYQDENSKLYYVVARWYAPTLGRFLSQDPVTGEVALPQTRDQYAYGAGDSIDQSDPSGRSSQFFQKFYMDVPSLKQTDWANVKAGGANPCGYTIGEIGCAMTDISMALRYYSLTVPYKGGAVTPDPDKLSQWMASPGIGLISKKSKCGITSWTSPKWGILGIKMASKAAPHSPKKAANMSQANQDGLKGLIDNEIDNGYPVIAEVTWPGGGTSGPLGTTPGGTHFVLITGEVDDDFYTNDPEYGPSQLFAQWGNHEVFVPGTGRKKKWSAGEVKINKTNSMYHLTAVVTIRPTNAAWIHPIQYPGYR
jgi:RHS repeat-associated protein